MALKGTLQDFSLADIFQLIGIQRKTGVLTVKHDQEVMTVSFVDGNVVGADSLHRRLEDRLGTVLVKSGQITEAQLQDALKIQKSTLQRMGKILVEHKFIDAKGLRDALQVQISQMVFRLFRWKTGEYDFSQEQGVEYDQEHVTPVSAESVLMEGARILDEWPMIEKAIRSFSMVFRRANVDIAQAAPGAARSASKDEAAGAVTLSEQERMVHGLVDGKRTVQEIIERSALGEFETCRILFELISRHLVEELRTAVRRGAATPVPAVEAAETSPLLIGLGYLVLILLAGGTILLRARPLVSGWDDGRAQFAWMEPIIGAGETEAIVDAIAENHLQRVDFAIQVYFLLNRGYPVDLRYLVTGRLLRPDAIVDPRGRPYLYQVESGTYKISRQPLV